MFPEAHFCGNWYEELQMLISQQQNYNLSGLMSVLTAPFDGPP